MASQVSQMETGRSLQSKLAATSKLKRPTSASSRGYTTQTKLGKSTSTRSFGPSGVSSPSQRGKLTGVRQPRSSSRDAGALHRRTSASAAKSKEVVKPHSYLRRSNSSLTRAYASTSQKKPGDYGPRKTEQKIISKSSIP
jgi:hypothetical protein